MEFVQYKNKRWFVARRRRKCEGESLSSARPLVELVNAEGEMLKVEEQEIASCPAEAFFPSVIDDEVMPILNLGLVKELQLKRAQDLKDLKDLKKTKRGTGAKRVKISERAAEVISKLTKDPQVAAVLLDLVKKRKVK